MDRHMWTCLLLAKEAVKTPNDFGFCKRRYKSLNKNNQLFVDTVS